MDVASVEQLLLTQVIGGRIVWHESVGSTNDVVRNMLPENPREGLVVCADEQTAGRGRFQRTWIATKGENLLCSILLVPPVADEKIPLLNFMASLSVVATLARYPGISAAVRWPNDVYVNGRKVCGILAERTGATVILGIGLNVNQRMFPGEIPNASSLALESNSTLDRGILLHVLLRELDDFYAEACTDGFDGIMRQWRAHCDMIGKPVTFRTGEERVDGITEQVCDDGAIAIRDRFGVERRFYAGEASKSS